MVSGENDHWAFAFRTIKSKKMGCLLSIKVHSGKVLPVLFIYCILVFCFKLTEELAGMVELAKYEAACG